MNKNLKNIISIIISISFLLTSCVMPDAKNQSTLNNPLQKTNTKNFSLASLKINTDKDIDIDFTDNDSTIDITTERSYPKNSSIDVEGMKLYSVNRIPEKIQPIEKITEARENLLNEWKIWYQDLIKSLRQTLISVQRSENIKSKEEFEKSIKNYSEGTSEYQKLVNKYNQETENRKKIDKQNMRDFKLAYETDWKNLKSKIISSMNKSFSTKGWLEDLFQIGENIGNWIEEVAAPTVIAIAKSFPGASQLTDFIQSIIGNSANNIPKENTTSTPPTDNNPPSPVNNDTKPKYSIPIDPNPVTDSKNPVSTITVDHVESRQDQIIQDYNDIATMITTLKQDGENKYVLPLQIKDLFLYLGIHINDFSSINQYNNFQVIDIKELKSNPVGMIAVSTLGLENIRDIVNNTGESIKYDSFGNIIGNPSNLRVKIGFNLVSSKNLTDMLKNALAVAKGTDWQATISKEANITIEELNKKIDSLKDKTLSISLTSPIICKQTLKTKFESDKLVSFKASLARRIMYDGTYKYNVNIIDRSDSNTVTNTKTIFSKDINITDLLGISLEKTKFNINKPLQVTPLGFYDTTTELQSELLTNADYIEHKPTNNRYIDLAHNTLRDFSGTNTQPKLEYSQFGFNVKNNTGNLWDMRIKRVGDNETCKPLYVSNCIDTSTADILYAKSVFDTGLYRLDTSYNIYPDIVGKNLYFPEKNYTDFLITQINYSTFSRISTKPEQSLMYTEQDASDVSQNDNGYSFLKISADKTKNMYYDLDNDSGFDSINEPNDLPNSDNSVNITNPEINRFLSTSGETFQNVPNLTKQSKNLFKDMLTSNTSFNTSIIKACPSDEYMHVGAIVDLSSKVARNNIKIIQKDNKMSMVMVIVDKNQSHIDSKTGITVYKPVKRFPFKAKLGSVTVVQKYWDGKTDDSSSQDLFNNEGLPSYKSGSYEVQVYPSLAYDNEASAIRSNFGAYVISPYINGHSTNATIDINEEPVCNLTCNESKTQIKSIQQQINNLYSLIDKYTVELSEANAEAEIDEISNIIDSKLSDIDSLEQSYQTHFNNIKNKCPNCSDFGTDLQSQSCLIKNPRVNNLNTAKLSKINAQLNNMVAFIDKNFDIAGFKIKSPGLAEKTKAAIEDAKTATKSANLETNLDNKKKLLTNAKAKIIRALQLMRSTSGVLLNVATTTVGAFTIASLAGTVALNYFGDYQLNPVLESGYVKIYDSILILTQTEVEALINLVNTKQCVETQNRDQIDSIVADMLIALGNIRNKFNNNLIPAFKNNNVSDFKVHQQDIENLIKQFKIDLPKWTKQVNDLCDDDCNNKPLDNKSFNTLAVVNGEYSTSRNEFEGLIVKEYLGPDGSGEYKIVGSLATTVSSVPESRLAIYNQLTPNKQQQLKTKFPDISKNDLPKWIKLRGEAYVKLTNNKYRRAEVHFYQIETKCKKIYYYETHVASKRGSSQTTGWIGDELQNLP